MQNVIKFLFAGLIGILLTACASSGKRTDHTDLYQGAPVESLSVAEPPVSEAEAIRRADKALSEQNLDLALYEYIRSLSFADATQQSDSLINIAQIHQSRENLVLAETAYLRALDFNPNSIKSLNQLGGIYSQSGKTEQGKNYFLKAVNADQSKPENRINDFKTVTGQQVAALSVSNHSPLESYIGLGTLSDAEGRYDTAKGFYEKAVQIHPESAEALFKLGNSHYSSGDYPLAKRFMRSALQHEPENQAVVSKLAIVHVALDEPVQALSLLMRYMKAPEALYSVGRLLLSQNSPEEAVSYLQQAVDKKASDYQAANKALKAARQQAEAKKN